MERLAEFRRIYAARLLGITGLLDPALERAFAAVPREAFLGAGPWRLMGEGPDGQWTWQTPEADPAFLYDNVLVSIDAARDLNNGMPDYHVRNMHALAVRSGDRIVHIGTGTGYYTAILAHLAGRSGQVTGLEIDPLLAARSRSNLAPRSGVTIVIGNGMTADAGPADAIYVNAGAAWPAPLWLDRLADGGRLVLPLTAAANRGRILAVTRRGDAYEARFLGRVSIFPCLGGRNPDAEERLRLAFDRGDPEAVRSLRRDTHDPDESCWLHGAGFCLSTSPPATENSRPTLH